MKPAENNLAEKAAEVQKNAYAPYSKFLVGCALVGNSGQTYVGCNVENACYPAGICAERNAISQAIAHGEKSIKELAIVSSSDKPCMPCGICLQVISEFSSPDLEITMASSDLSKIKRIKFKELLPHAFDNSFLK